MSIAGRTPDPAAAADATVVDPDAFSTLYLTQFTSLARIAAALLGKRADAEDVVQEAYVRVALSQSRLRDPDKMLAYLRQTVVNLSRSVLRRRMLARRHAITVPAAADDSALDAVLRREAVLVALQRLPRRRREALVLRYYADLSLAQTAAALGVSVGTVKSSCARGLTDLARLLKDET